MANASDFRKATSRDKVFEALTSEREYQTKRWGYRQNDGSFKEPDHSVCDYMVYIKHYLAKAFAEASEKPGSGDALEMLRKVVTLGVACFEQHGVTPRNLDNVVNARDGKPA